MPFLSLLDDRARPKGSRDPLGLEMVWTHFGRKVVGNLTTITSSWRIFSVGLLGFHWCNQLCRDAHPVDKQRLLQEHFIRYEQLAAYLRSIAGDNEIMGITRVRKRLDNTRKTIDIGIDQKSLILSDQISYGIWGLYSSALRETGLVKGDYRELTERGLGIVRLIEDGILGKAHGADLSWYWSLIRGERKAVSVEDLERSGKGFIKAISETKVMDALISALLQGSGDHPCQLALYETCRALPKAVLESGDLDTLIPAIRSHADSKELHDSLDNIAMIERLLVTANVLFSYMRRKDGENLISLAEAIDRLYRFDYLSDGPELRDVPYGPDLDALRSHLRSGDTQNALRGLLKLNKKIMAGRGGAAWVEEAGAGSLRVRVKAETAHLPSMEKLQRQWDYDYFLRSYARIAANLRR